MEWIRTPVDGRAGMTDTVGSRARFPASVEPTGLTNVRMPWYPAHSMAFHRVDDCPGAIHDRVAVRNRRADNGHDQGSRLLGGPAVASNVTKERR